MAVSEGASHGLDSDIDIRTLFSTLLSQKLLTVAIVGLCSLASAAIALSITPVYRADALIVIAQNDTAASASSLADQLGGLASFAGLRMGTDRADREFLAMLASRRLAEEFIKRNDLLPVLLPKARNPTLWLGVRRLRGDVLTISEDTRRGTNSVSVEWTDPVLAAQWANGFVDLANETIRARAIDYANRNIKYLEEQVLRTNVVEVQRVLYNLIESETKTLMLATARSEYAFSVVDPAVPPEMRIRPQRTMMVAFGAVLGALISVAVALARMLAKSRRR